MFNPFSLEGKTILVTGASSGIGMQCAVTCSMMGARVVIAGRNKERLSETRSLLYGDDHISFIGDLTCPNSLRALADSVPQLDGIIHCAGVGQRVLCKNVKEKDVESVMDSNFKAPVLLQQILLETRRINKGASIVFISSMAVWSPSIGNALYSASKGAISSYARCLSLELAPRGIRVNCISPAMVWTNLILQEGIDKEQLEEDEKTYPLKRYGSPKDIAYLSVYMLSDASSWMTGSNVKISGGAK